MRTTFASELLKVARRNPKVILLTGDLGYSVFEEFRRLLPDQYINAGIAEQNMTGVAAGLAMEGFIPVIYSIVPFTTMRNFEQVRNDICYQGLNVKIVGVGAGFAYGPYGHTHHGLEDMGILRTLPDMTILAPGDPYEVRGATAAMMEHDGPVYLRIGKKGEPNIHTAQPEFRIGKAFTIRDGRDVTIIAVSTMLERGRDVATYLTESGVSVRLLSMPTVKPLDVEALTLAARDTTLIAVIEEHSVIGGLGSAVSEFVSGISRPVRVIRIGVPDRFTKEIGLQEFMREKNGLTVRQITDRIVSELSRNESVMVVS